MTERITPHPSGAWENLATYLIYLRHLAAYRFVLPSIQQKRVLDLGCGTGYGTKFLSLNGAKWVVGIDLAQTALKTFDFSSPQFVSGNILQLPFRAEEFDIIVSFQVIEHILDEFGYLKEINRVLKPGGQFIVTTPNKALRLLPFQPPFNPFHVREYTHRSLRSALCRQIGKVELLGLHATPQIMKVEQERLKQNPVHVYSQLLREKPLSSSLPLRKIKRLLFKYKPTSSPNSLPPAKTNVEATFSEDDYSVEDFWVSSNNLSASLDLVGICYKR